MAGYQRMVSYLYEYNQGEKGTNVGYAKLEIREDIAKMIVSIRLRSDVTEECPVGFYYWEGRQAYRVPVGEIKLTGGRVQDRLLLPGARAGESGLPVTQMNGILISLPDGWIGSAWDEQSVPTEATLWNEKQKQNEIQAGRGDLQRTENGGELQAAELWAAELQEVEVRETEQKIVEGETWLEDEAATDAGTAATAMTEMANGMEPASQNAAENELSSREILPEETMSEEWRPETFFVSPSVLANAAPENRMSSNNGVLPNNGVSFQSGMREVPLTKPREGNDYRSKSWMEETQREGEEAQNRQQEEFAGSNQERSQREFIDSNQAKSQGEFIGSNQERDQRDFIESNRARSQKEFTELDQARQQEEPTANPIEYFFQQSTKMCPFEDEAITSCVRIEPADLEYFPKETWILGSNSFLLHGYYTYGHLILAKMKGMGRESVLIGVPGLYQNRERFLARLFGFEYFKPISKTGAAEGDFGYWYLFLPDM